MTIIHGEDSTTSYQKLVHLTSNLKASGQEIVVIDAATVDITSLRQLISGGLFGGDKVFVVKNLLGGHKSKQKDQILDEISNIKDQEVVVYEPKALTTTQLKHFPKAKVESYNINPVIFKYLDMLRPGNSKNLFAGWKRLVELGNEPEYIFTMIVRQIRLLIQAKSGASYLKMKPYPKQLISSQAKVFELSQLLELHALLYDIDKQIKTGQASLSMELLMPRFFLKF